MQRAKQVSSEFTFRNFLKFFEVGLQFVRDGVEVILNFFVERNPMSCQGIVQVCDEFGVPTLGPDGLGRVRTLMSDPG
jgi:hypothetical protein